MSASETPTKLLLSSREAAAALSICQKTLYAQTAPRGPIRAVRIGSRVLYAIADLEVFISSQQKENRPG